jgi:hypothetical protein
MITIGASAGLLLRPGSLSRLDLIEKANVVGRKSNCSADKDRARRNRHPQFVRIDLPHFMDGEVGHTPRRSRKRQGVMIAGCSIAVVTI